jgi:hypothetical protein
MAIAELSHDADRFNLDAYVARSRALDLAAIPWDDVARHPVPDETIRTLHYMQNIESHTIKARAGSFHS